MVKVAYKDTYTEVVYEASNLDDLKDLIEIAKEKIIPKVLEGKTFSCGIVGTMPDAANNIKTPNYHGCL